MTLSCTGTGIGVSRGIAIGKAHLLQRNHLEISPRHIEPKETSSEVIRFYHAVAGARKKLRAIREQIPDDTRSDIAAFIDTHLLMLDDAPLIEAPVDLIREKHYAAEWALQVQRDALVDVFDAMEDPYLRTRKDDIDHVVNQIQLFLLEQEEDDLDNLEGKIILAQDLTPADTILFRHRGVAGFVTEFGGPMSHTAILARSLGIPAVVGVHNATHCLRHGEILVVDGQLGTVLADADERTLNYYRGQIAIAEARKGQLRKLITEPTVTLDGQQLTLMANIELPEDIITTRSMGADGVGLYRTEFLYMNRSQPPCEEEHYEAYKKVVQGLNGIPITIRTLDLGADKRVDRGPHSEAPICNPALGLRAIRLCLKEPKLFKPQLRAILRAAIFGPVKMMIPMISNLHEVKQIKAIIGEVKAELTRENTLFAADIPVGGMIETPAAALAANALCKELDFLSIGTNDLIQYTLAIDRVDDEVNYLFDPLHPSVLRLIRMTIDAGRRHNTPVAMCGEMAGDPRYIPLLLGMGLKEFSMQPNSLLEAKQILRSCNADKLTAKVDRLLARIEAGETPDPLSQL